MCRITERFFKPRVDGDVALTRPRLISILYVKKPKLISQ